MNRRHAQALFEQHHLELYRFLLRSCGSIGAAEDLTQEVFARALRDGIAVPSKGSERAWLFRIARNLLIDRWRRGDRLAEQPIRNGASIATAPQQELRASLQSALQHLSVAEREAFLLGQVGGLSYAEIARATDSSRSAVRSRIYRARLALRQQLGSEDGDE